MLLRIWFLIFFVYFVISFSLTSMLLSLYIPRVKNSRYFLISMLSTLWFILVYALTFPVFREIFHFGPIQFVVVTLRFCAYAIMMVYLLEVVLKASKIRSLISVIGLFLPNYILAGSFNLYIFPHSPVRNIFDFFKIVIAP